MQRQVFGLLILVLPLMAQVRSAEDPGLRRFPEPRAAEGIGSAGPSSGPVTGARLSAGFPEGQLPAYSDYRLGAEDVVSVFVLDAPEFSRTVRVDGSGAIRLPMLKTPIAAEGKTSAELEQEVARLLVQEGLLREPSVAATVREINSKPITVTGAVRVPVVIQAPRRLRLSEVLSRAGGFSDMAGGTVEVSVPARAGQAAQVFTVPLQGIAANSEGAGMLLSGGEEVRVISAGRVFMFGGVQKPGPLPIGEGQPLTLLQAVSLAGGPTEKVGGKGLILRAAADGRQQLTFDTRKLIRGEGEDLALKPDDMVYIPDSRLRRYSEAMVSSAITTFTYGVIGALLWR